ncbi:transcription elongation factor [Antarcticibacterium arcticum]|uniref:Transcription elongation factor n=1 Tax=Antarcticibacterium arcticum TaxID=2585771 RepID=A0A5B8YHI8_9FLAO|nr:transcription elongation factor [Antarcticibacterium arcticum]QED37051.1 transcription elongation factor [Antarcticibacterium arcticum]
MVHNKKEVFQKCLIVADQLIQKYQDKMDNIKESMEANDVHTDYDEEGSNGELLGDFERYASLLDNARKMKETLSRVDREHYSEQIKFGSLIETEKNYYFIAAPLGNVGMDDGSIIYAISTDAPIYEKLEGKSKGDTFSLKDEEIKILDVH